jgi:hypothetical protein
MKHVVSIISLVACLLGSSAVSADVVVDQQFIPVNISEASVQPIADGPSYGQTFTVGISGRLVGADIALDAGDLGRPLNDVLVEVTPTLGGLPTATVLASGIIPGASIPLFMSTGLLTHVDFSAAPTITAGQQLALLFFGEGELGDNPNIALEVSSGLLYPGGQAVIFAFDAWHPAADFFLGTSADFGFRTYVSIPEPSTFVLLIGSFAVIAFLRRRSLPPSAAKSETNGSKGSASRGGKTCIRSSLMATG